MVKLESNFKEDKICIRNIKMCFESMEDCNKFLYVFRDHWCNVPWTKPVEVDKVPDGYSLVKDPIKEAEGNLNWGFRQCERSNIGNTIEQKALTRAIMNIGLQ